MRSHGWSEQAGDHEPLLQGRRCAGEPVRTKVDRFPDSGCAPARNGAGAEASLDSLTAREDTMLALGMTADDHIALMRTTSSLSGLHARINSASV
jgi:hypothetical protein